MLLSRAGLAGAPAIKLGNLMNVEMPLAELDDLARSARALQLHAAGPPSDMAPPPEIDQQVLAYAREMFVGGPGWPVLPLRICLIIPPSNLQLFVAAEVVEFLFRHEKARFEVAAGQWLQMSEARGYLLTAQSGYGLLTSAQAAHDIGSKAAKQVVKAQADARRAGKAARKRAPEAARDADAAAARSAVWDEGFTDFANLPGVTKPTPPSLALRSFAGYRSWDSGPSARAASAFVEEKAAQARAVKALAELQQPPAPSAPCHPPPAAAVASPVTDETPRHIRLRPSPSAKEEHDLERSIFQEEMFIMELDLKLAHEELAHEELAHEESELREVELERELAESRASGVLAQLESINWELNDRNEELVKENNKLKEAMKSELEVEEELEGEELETYHTVCEALEFAMGGRHVTTWVPHGIPPCSICGSMLCMCDV